MKQNLLFLRTHASRSMLFFLFVFFSACYQSEEIRPLLDGPYEDQILPVGVYQAIDERVETAPFQMIIRKADHNGKKFIISNFADLRIDVELKATEEAIDLVAQNLGQYQGIRNVLLSGSMHKMQVHEYRMTYRMREEGVEINRELLVSFIGPCK